MRLLMFAILGLLAGQLYAQSGYPTKPIRLIVPFPPGASNDTIGRAFGQKMSEALGQQVVVDNRAGAGGSIGAAIVAKAPPDGYTLMVTSTSYATNAAVQKELAFDPIRDVAAIAIIGRGPMMVVVSPSVAAQSVQELLALAKAKPGQVNYASSGIGSAPHLATELFLRHTGIDMTHVPYKGLGPAMSDLYAGRTQVLIASLPSVLSHVKANRLRGIAITSAQRSSFTPGVPTVAEAGVPGYVSELWWGLFVPAQMSSALMTRLNVEARKLVAASEMKQLLAGVGAEPAHMAPLEFNAFVRDEIAKWRKVVQERGIKAE
jgi:tripartite-type tricarboxylate transporter receptor subunit TctC